MAKGRKKRSGGCLTLILILVAIGGFGSLFGGNQNRSTRPNISVNSSASSYYQKTATPRRTATPKITASPKVTSALSTQILAGYNDVQYSGTYKNNKPYNGIISYKSNGASVERKVENGQLSREHTITVTNATITAILSDEEKIEDVTIIYANGDTYIGHIVNGKKRGQGKYRWTNGAWYAGSWYNDTMSGKGTYYYTKDPLRNYLVGTFINGQPQGTLTFVSDKRINYTTQWKNGQCISIERK